MSPIRPRKRPKPKASARKTLKAQANDLTVAFIIGRPRPVSREALAHEGVDPQTGSGGG